MQFHYRKFRYNFTFRLIDAVNYVLNFVRDDSWIDLFFLFVMMMTDPLYVSYHDEEWGVPVHDDK